MIIEDVPEEIYHLLDEIEQQLESDPTPENASRLKPLLRHAATLVEQRAHTFKKLEFLELYQSKQDELNKSVEGFNHAKGFIERRHRMNDIVAIVRNGLTVAENTIRETGIEDSSISRLVEGHRTMLKEAEKLRESFGLLGIVVKISKALFRDAQRLLSRRRIRKPPGTRWLQFTEFFFSPKTVEGTFRPIAADWQYEHFDALNKGRNFKARWIWVRYNYAFVKTVGLNNLLSFLKWVVSIFRG